MSYMRGTRVVGAERSIRDAAEDYAQISGLSVGESLRTLLNVAFTNEAMNFAREELGMASWEPNDGTGFQTFNEFAQLAEDFDVGRKAWTPEQPNRAARRSKK